MAVTRFQFRGRLGQRVAEIVEDAVENDGERIGLVANRAWLAGTVPFREFRGIGVEKAGGVGDRRFSRRTRPA